MNQSYTKYLFLSVTVLFIYFMPAFVQAEVGSRFKWEVENNTDYDLYFEEVRVYGLVPSEKSSAYMYGVWVDAHTIKRMNDKDGKPTGPFYYTIGRNEWTVKFSAPLNEELGKNAKWQRVKKECLVKETDLLSGAPVTLRINYAGNKFNMDVHTPVSEPCVNNYIDKVQ
jgi:hypothetical protein